MKYDGKIEISWKAASGDITTMAQGREVDMIDALAKSTAAILKDSSLDGLCGKALLNVYIEFLTDLYKKKTSHGINRHKDSAGLHQRWPP